MRKARITIIKFPKSVNKIRFVYDILARLKNAYPECDIVNFTSAPTDEFCYVESDHFYCRIINPQYPEVTSIDIDAYRRGYINDKVSLEGLTFDEYIDYCFLFELEEIRVIFKKDVYDNKKIDSPILTIMICPDGLDEIHVFGEESALELLQTVIVNI